MQVCQLCLIVPKLACSVGLRCLTGLNCLCLQLNLTLHLCLVRPNFHDLVGRQSAGSQHGFQPLNLPSRMVPIRRRRGTLIPRIVRPPGGARNSRILHLQRIQSDLYPLRRQSHSLNILPQLTHFRQQRQQGIGRLRGRLAHSPRHRKHYQNKS